MRQISTSKFEKAIDRILWKYDDRHAVCVTSYFRVVPVGSVKTRLLAASALIDKGAENAGIRGLYRERHCRDDGLRRPHSNPRMFERERGVIVLERPEAIHKRRYRSIRIPALCMSAESLN